MVKGPETELSILRRVYVCNEGSRNLLIVAENKIRHKKLSSLTFVSKRIGVGCEMSP